MSAGRTSRGGADRPGGLFQTIAPVFLMLCGLATLATPWILAQSDDTDPDAVWTESEKQEFRELYTTLHQSPVTANQSERDKQNAALYSRIDALDQVRTDRQDGLRSRDRWLRIVGGSLLVLGLGIYFATNRRAET